MVSIRIVMLPWWGRAIVFVVVFSSLVAATSITVMRLGGHQLSTSTKVLVIAMAVVLPLEATFGLRASRLSLADSYRAALRPLTTSAQRKRAITAVWRGPIPEDASIRTASVDLARHYLSAHEWRSTRTLVVVPAFAALLFVALAVWPREEHSLELGDPHFEGLLAFYFAVLMAKNWYAPRRVSRRLKTVIASPDQNTRAAPPAKSDQPSNDRPQKPATSAELLFEEAHRLSAGFPAEEVLTTGLDGISLLREGLREANPRAQGIFRDTLQRNGEVADSLRGFNERAHALLRRYRQDDLSGRIEEMLAHLHRVDVNKLVRTVGNPDLLGEAERRRDNVYRVNDVTSLCIASAEIPVYSLAYAHADASNVFLGRPPKYRATLSSAGALMQAVALDFAGLAFPFVGTLKTVFEEMEPWIDKEVEKIKQAAQQMNRIYNFCDALSGLSSQYVPFVGDSINAANNLYDSFVKEFTTDLNWLNRVFIDAAKD
jgi:hypothetical protein